MTRGEAINRVSELAMFARIQGWDDEYTDAVDMAIEALSAEPCDSKNKVMNFPETWEEYEECYGFNDTEENLRLIPSFLVKQWLDHLEQEPSIASASEWCKQNGYVMMRESDYEQAITKAYFEGQNASTSEIPNKWIPVSERLPEKEGRYLTTIFNGIRYIMTCEYSSFSNCWFPDNDECASDNVIAWMPLPEPYVAEEGGE